MLEVAAEADPSSTAAAAEVPEVPSISVFLKAAPTGPSPLPDGEAPVREPMRPRKNVSSRSGQKPASLPDRLSDEPDQPQQQVRACDYRSNPDEEQC